MIGPQPSGDEGYVEIAVRFAAADGRVAARVETPAGDGEWQPFTLALAGDEAEALAHGVLLDACVPGRGDEHARRLGQALFTGLLHGQSLERYRASQGPARTAAPPLRLRFHLGTGSEAERALHRLPWELFCEPGPGGGRLLALDRRLSVVRHLTIGDGVPAMARPPRLRVLVAAAEGRAPGAPPLDLGGEIAAIRAGCPPGGDVAVEVLRPAPLEALIERLREGRFHVLHLIGHGELGGGDGVVLLPDADGRLVACRGEQLAQQIGGLSPLRLVVLNACRTAEAVAERPFAGVATALLKHGLPAAVAMQAPITDGAAARFAAVLYARLAAGASLDAAVAEGRLAISWRRPRTFEWAVPVLFSRLPGGELFAAPAAADGARGESGGAGAAAAGGAGRRADGTAADRGSADALPRMRRSRRLLAAVVAAALLAIPAFLVVQAVRNDRQEGRSGGAGLEEPAPAVAVALEPAEGNGSAANAPLAAGDRGSGGAAEGTPADGPAMDQEAEEAAPARSLTALLPTPNPEAGEVEPPAPPGRSEPREVEPSRPRGPSGTAPPFAPPNPECGSFVAARSGDTLTVPRLDALLVPEIRSEPGLDPYVVLFLLGTAADTWRTTNRRGDLDFRPDAPLVVSLLGFEPGTGTVRLSCRLVSAHE